LDAIDAVTRLYVDGTDLSRALYARGLDISITRNNRSAQQAEAGSAIFNNHGSSNCISLTNLPCGLRTLEYYGSLSLDLNRTDLAGARNTVFDDRSVSIDNDITDLARTRDTGYSDYRGGLHCANLARTLDACDFDISRSRNLCSTNLPCARHPCGANNDNDTGNNGTNEAAATHTCYGDIRVYGAK
jgi:hypothetical protein